MSDGNVGRKKKSHISKGLKSHFWNQRGYSIHESVL